MRRKEDSIEWSIVCGNNGWKQWTRLTGKVNVMIRPQVDDDDDDGPMVDQIYETIG